MSVYKDLFSGTAGTALSAHTSDSGATYTRSGGGGSDIAFLDGSGHLYFTIADSTIYTVTGYSFPPSGPIQLTFDLDCVTSANSSQLQLLNGSGNGYRFLIFSNTLYFQTADAVTAIGSASVTLAAGHTYPCSIEKDAVGNWTVIFDIGGQNVTITGLNTTYTPTSIAFVGLTAGTSSTGLMFANMLGEALLYATAPVATQASATSIMVTWPAPTGGTAPLQWKLQRAPDVSGSPGTYADVTSYGTATSYTDTGLTTGNYYWYRIAAEDSTTPTPATVVSAGFKIQATAPVATGTVEYILDATSVVSSDSGSSGNGVANGYDGSFTTYFGSSSPNAWYGLDLGGGNQGVPTRILMAPGNLAGHDADILGGTFDVAASTSGPWSNLGSVGTGFLRTYHFNAFTFPAAGGCRVIRVAAPPSTYLYLGELRVEGWWASGLRWKPCRPVFSVLGNMPPAGSSISISSSTTNASVYYTVGYQALTGAWAGSTAYALGATVSNGGNVYQCVTPGTSAGSGGPSGTGSGITDGSCSWNYVGVLSVTATTGSTLYSGPLVLPSIPSGCFYAISAVAYHASGTVTTSDVVTQVYNKQEFIFDACAPRFPESAVNSPGDMLDNLGYPLEAHGGDGGYDPGLGAQFVIGQYMDTSVQGGDVQPRGQWLYTSTDCYQWTAQGMAIPLPPNNSSYQVSSQYFDSQTRPHILRNPSPISSSNKYVAYVHLDIVASGYTKGYIGVASTQNLSTQFTWAPGGPIQPTGPSGTVEEARDCSPIFTDPNTGYTWICYTAANIGGTTSIGLHAARLDPATDCMDFLSANAIVLFGGAGREAPVLFYGPDNYYYLISSVGYAYGGSNSTNVYYRSATTLAGLASATDHLLFNFTPASPSVAYFAQPTGVMPVNGHQGLILMMDWWDSYSSPLVLEHSRLCWVPMPPSAFNNGTLTLPCPNAWNLSSLTASTSITASPSTIERGESGQAVTVAITGATSTSTSDWTLSGTGAAITGINATDPANPILTVTAPASDGAATLTHVPSGATATLTVHDTTAPPTPTGISLGSPTALYSVPATWSGESDTYGGSVTYTAKRNGSVVQTGISGTTYTFLGVSDSDVLAIDAVDGDGNTSSLDSATFHAPSSGGGGGHSVQLTHGVFYS